MSKKRPSSPAPRSNEGVSAWTILVVEDDEALNRLIQQRLNRAGYRTEGIFSGREAVELAKNMASPLLLIDYRLPDMLGKELVEEISEHEHPVPFVVMTGQGDEKIAVEMMKLGARDYLVKEANFLDLLPGVIDRLISELNTEKKLETAEKMLKASEENYRTLFDNAGDAIFIHALGSTIIEVNKMAVDSLGYSREAMLRMGLQDITHDSAKAHLTECLSELSKHDRVFFEIDQVKKDGTRIPTEITSVLFDYNGRPAVLSIARDVSRRKQLEKQLQQSQDRTIAVLSKARADIEEHSEHLEQMVDDRTRELRDTQEKLIKRERLAVLGQLAGGVAHELRNPLGVISNAVYYLRSVHAEADKTTRKHLQMISSEVKSAEKIISDLLDLSRTKSAKRDGVVVSALISRVLKSYEAPEGVHVQVEAASDLPPVYVDAQQVGQVLLNLIANGCQAMEREGGVLSVRGRAVDGGVELSVSDSGCGISEEDMGRLFEPLFTTKARGIGLGLAVSKNLVEVNGGRIEVESEKGAGSSFRVFLPECGED